MDRGVTMPIDHFPGVPLEDNQPSASERVKRLIAREESRIAAGKGSTPLQVLHELLEEIELGE